MNSLAESMFGMMTVVSSTGVPMMVPAVTLSSLGVAMADAGLSAICSQAASSLLQTGSLKEMSQDLTSSQFAKSLTITLASAGLMNKLSGTLNLPTQPKGWEHLKVNATRSLVTTPLHVFIGGEKPEEALLDGVKSCVAHTVGGITSNSLGDLYGKGNLPYLLHKGGHFGTGFLLSLGLSEGDIKEAIGAGMAAMMAEVGAESLPSSLSREARGNIAKVGGSLAGLLAGAKKGTGIFTACNAIDHNFMWTIPLAARLTPRMLAALGLSGMTAYEVGQWLKDHPMLMDMLPEGILGQDPGFMPEESKAEILTTPSHEDKSFILQTPIADPYSLILQTPIYDGPDTSILLKEEAPKRIQRPLHEPNAGGSITSFVTTKEETYYRVYSKRLTGAFLTKQRPNNRLIAQEGLALPPSNTALYIQEVIVPKGVRLQRSRALPVPSWGRNRGGMEQFQLLEAIPRENFKKGKKFK